ncbi:MAG TPA: calcium-binding protein [Actinomycetota bacterium]|nr:calcium-binding protein [Actinomycetota bacterium]
MVEGLKRNVVNLNAAESTGIDHDVVLNGVENILLEGDKRADVLGAQGGAATGKSTTLSVRLVGGRGKDKLTGSRFGDRIEGGGFACSPCKARKVIKGMGGPDQITSSDGRDRILGGKGNDEISGKQGNDKLFGNRGQDELKGAQGNDRLDGGPDRDDCTGGPGFNTIKNCE